MLRKLKHVGKKAFRYKFIAALNHLDVQGSKSWQPFKLAIVCMRRKKKISGKAQSWRPSIENPYKGAVNWTAHNQESLEISVTFFRNQQGDGYEPKEWVFVLENEAQNGKRKAIATARLEMSQYIMEVPSPQQIDVMLKPLSNKLKSASLKFTLTCIFVSEGIATDSDLASMAGSTTSEDTIALGNIDIADIRDLDDTDIEGSSRGSTIGGHSNANSSLAQNEWHNLTQKIESLNQPMGDQPDSVSTTNHTDLIEGQPLKRHSRHTSSSSAQSEQTSTSHESSSQTKRLEQLDEDNAASPSITNEEKRQSCSSDAASSHASTPKQKHRLRPSVDFLPPTQVEVEATASTNSSPATDNQKSILRWCQRVTGDHKGVKVTNFTTSWRNGLALCAILHHYRPDLIDYASLTSLDGKQNVRKAVNGFNSMRLPGVKDVTAPYLSDKNNLVTFLSQVRDHFEAEVDDMKSLDRTDTRRLALPTTGIIHRTNHTTSGLCEMARIKLLSDLEEKEDECDFFSAQLDDVLERDGADFSEQFSPGPRRPSRGSDHVETFAGGDDSGDFALNRSKDATADVAQRAELPISAVLKMPIPLPITEREGSPPPQSEYSTGPVAICDHSANDKPSPPLSRASSARSTPGKRSESSAEASAEEADYISPATRVLQDVEIHEPELQVELEVEPEPEVSPITKHSLSKDSAIECGSDVSFFETHAENVATTAAPRVNDERPLDDATPVADVLEEKTEGVPKSTVEREFEVEVKLETKVPEAISQEESMDESGTDPLRETVDRLLKSSAARNKKAKTLELIEKAKSQVNASSKREVSEKAQQLIDEARATLGRSASPKYPEERRKSKSAEAPGSPPSPQAAAAADVSDRWSVEGASTKRQASDGPVPDAPRALAASQSESDTLVNALDDSGLSTSKSDTSSGFESSNPRDNTDDSLCERTAAAAGAKEPQALVGEKSAADEIAESAPETSPRTSEPLEESRALSSGDQALTSRLGGDRTSQAETVEAPRANGYEASSCDRRQSDTKAAPQVEGQSKTRITDSMENLNGDLSEVTADADRVDTFIPPVQVERRKKTTAAALVERLSVAGASELHKRLSTALQKKSTSDDPNLDVVSELENERLALEKEQRVVEERSLEVQMELQELKNLGNRGKKQNEAQLMQEWFQLVHKKNAILRQQDQLALMEEEQEILAKVDTIHDELIPLMEIEDVMKTLAQKEREKVLLEEKFRLVNERNRIMEDMNEKEQMALEEEERLQTSLGANMSKVIKDDEKCAIM